jgi:hypothetical protein
LSPKSLTRPQSDAKGRFLPLPRSVAAGTGSSGKPRSLLSTARISYLDAIIEILHGTSRGTGIHVCTDPTFLPIRPSTLHLPSGAFLKSSISQHSSMMESRLVILCRVRVLVFGHIFSVDVGNKVNWETAGF